MIKGEAVVEFSIVNIDPEDKDKLVWMLDRIRTEANEVGVIPRMNVSYSEAEVDIEEKPEED